MEGELDGRESRLLPVCSERGLEQKTTITKHVFFSSASFTCALVLHTVLGERGVSNGSPFVERDLEQKKTLQNI